MIQLMLTIFSCVQSEDANPRPLLFAPFHGASLSGAHRFQQTIVEHDDDSLGTSDKQLNEKPCCFPKVWQGQMYRYFSLQYIEYFLTFYEDDPNLKFALDIVATPGNSTSPTKVSQIVQMDPSGSKAFIYQFDKVAKKCTCQQFDNVTYDQITAHCVPDDAFYAGEFPMGIPKGGSSFNVRSWMWKPAPKELPDIHYERLVSSDCAPVLGITRGTLNGEPLLQSDYFFNIQTSISDPSVFNVPDYCKTAEALSGNTEGYLNVLMIRHLLGNNKRK